MNPQSIEKQIINWNVHTFQNLKSVVDLIHRAQQKQKPNQYDYKMRDFYFQPSFDMFGMKNRRSFIDYAADLIKNFLSFNQLGYLQSIHFQHQMQKYKFWKQLYRKTPKNQSDHEAKLDIKGIVWTYRLIPICFFLFGISVIQRMAGINKMTSRKQIVGLLAAAIVGNVFVTARKSSQIFYLISPLGDADLQKKRIDIVNKSIVLDSKINQIEFHPQYVDELIEQADKQSDQKTKKQILQAAGYIVVDNKQFEQ